MANEELIQALDRLKVQTGSLACLGCGYEHNCTTKGCRILREAVERLRAAGEILAAAHSSWAEQPRAAMYSFSWSQKRIRVSSRMISLIIHQAGEKEKTGGGNNFRRGYCRGGKRHSEREEKQV